MIPMVCLGLPVQLFAAECCMTTSECLVNAQKTKSIGVKPPCNRSHGKQIEIVSSVWSSIGNICSKQIPIFAGWHVCWFRSSRPIFSPRIRPMRRGLHLAFLGCFLLKFLTLLLQLVELIDSDVTGYPSFFREISAVVLKHVQDICDMEARLRRSMGYICMNVITTEPVANDGNWMGGIIPKELNQAI